MSELMATEHAPFIDSLIKAVSTSPDPSALKLTQVAAMLDKSGQLTGANRAQVACAGLIRDPSQLRGELAGTRPS